MPEALEVERYRGAAEALVGRAFGAVTRADPLVVDEAVPVVIPGARVERVGRIGKLLLVTTDGPVLGLHFGMTGRLVIDDRSVIERLAYSPVGDRARWDRLVIAVAGGGSLRLHDPRRLGRVTLDPDPSRLGPDVLTLTRRALTAALGARRAPVKAVLLDQQRIAGLGNLLADEVLWWAGIDPRRAAGQLLGEEVAALHRAIRRRLPVMLRRGGSHTGVLSPAVRATGGPCPRDGAPLARATVGGRTTVWCPVHQV